MFPEVLESPSPIMGAKGCLEFYSSRTMRKNVSTHVTYFSVGLIMFMLLIT